MLAKETNAIVLAKEPKVSVCVVTYNQVKYIAQCLQSLVDQKTDFDFEIIVGDDCSTDGTREVIKNFEESYPNIIFPIFHEKNLGPCGNIIAVYKKARGCYIAHLDGDDYALPGKLQAQSDFLDANSDCSVVWHRMKILDQKTGIFHDDLIDLRKIGKVVFKQEDLMAMGSIACHSSKFFRKSSLPSCYPDGDFLDFYLNIFNLSSGDAGYLDRFFGVYRAGIGLMQNPKIRDVFISNMRHLVEHFPNSASHGYSLLLRIAVFDFIKKRSGVGQFIGDVFRYSSLKTVFFLIKYIRYVRFFRSPVL